MSASYADWGGVSGGVGMSRRTDDIPIEFSCPACFYEVKQTFGWFDSHNEFICPDCAETFDFSGSEFLSAKVDIVRQAAHFGKGGK